MQAFSYLYALTLICIIACLVELVYQVHLAIRSPNISSNDSIATARFLELIDKTNPSGRYKIEKHLEPVECAVCLLTLEKGEKIRNLKCNHTFHKACVDTWLQQDSAVRCPLCRSTVLPEEIMVQLQEQRHWSQVYDEISEEEIVFFLSSVHGGPLYSVL
ncbi:hypothetical protein Vadar_033635 [Vaccinium darrowii]|uniref:Uncharacterized protein n=1 Tax=Vaccinium darrowii TaxID=229202 RepID=A0ACB7Z8G2_9ERIC|nr:hypothetical protein Vadar_033635 [Vaccinium darrowii]